VSSELPVRMQAMSRGCETRSCKLGPPDRPGQNDQIGLLKSELGFCPFTNDRRACQEPGVPTSSCLALRGALCFDFSAVSSALQLLVAASDRRDVCSNPGSASVPSPITAAHARSQAYPRPPVLLCVSPYALIFWLSHRRIGCSLLRLTAVTHFRAAT